MYKNNIRVNAECTAECQFAKGDQLPYPRGCEGFIAAGKCIDGTGYVDRINGMTPAEKQDYLEKVTTERNTTDE